MNAGGHRTNIWSIGRIAAATPIAMLLTTAIGMLAALLGLLEHLSVWLFAPVFVGCWALAWRWLRPRVWF